MKINNRNGFTLFETSIVILITCILVGTVYISNKLINLSKLANSINLTTKAKFLTNDSLVLWLETSIMSKGCVDKDSIVIENWKDLSKNRIDFTASNGLVFKDSKAYPWLKSVYFDGTTQLHSNKVFNLKKYTLFVVLAADLSNTQDLYDFGFCLTNTEISNSKIIEITNDGNEKCIKRGKNTNFVCSPSSELDNFTGINQLIIGNGFKGEFVGTMIFSKVLSNDELLEVETYLYNKYME